MIQTNNPWIVFDGFLLGAVLMVAAGAVAVFFGIDAERKSLESVADPLSAAKSHSAGAAGKGSLPQKSMGMQ
ncbi:hypothetical protein [Dictyobacter aurantiacus]|uniref:Uncharacterized protein n=1 Tax=Dictyobacter aurantiacus TaxID=1936993 RepID=A0A401ZMI8_9CHLR|nr:hypothetical protein [Dictyobacter aurantiacus]GCE08075.1 hypothetical protein KDAU_54040 [Dictyobacter aurantiacus]